MKPVVIGRRELKVPIIQGGMGIGVSRDRLAGAVAKEGAMGVLSAAQIGYDEADFAAHPHEANLRMLPVYIQRAKERACGNGMIGVNIMAVTQGYERYVRAACEGGADAIISGAGLAMTLPGAIAGDVKIAPIVSSRRACEVILKSWERKYGRTADFLVIEGPMAGGHLGFGKDELEKIDRESYKEEIRAILCAKHTYEERFGCRIPVFVAGGIMTGEEAREMIELGADGIQAATRFVVTEECDADPAYKQAYIDAEEDDVVIIDSPVGMPGRAIRNDFVLKPNEEKEKIEHCYACIKGCSPQKARYCISAALMRAVRGDVQNGLIFCGGRVGELKRMQTVKEVIEDLNGEK